MAKAIKFNLICDEKPIRTIEDLQNNFSVEDVLAYYYNKLLHRWLKVRGYTTELEAVEKINTSKPIDVINELIKIFDVETDHQKIEESIYMLEFIEERKEDIKEYEKKSNNLDSIINDYKSKYESLIYEIQMNPKNISKIKANISELLCNYNWIFKLDHRKLFYSFLEWSKLAVMCLLMNEEARKYYLPISKTTDNGKIVLDTYFNLDKDVMYKDIKQLIRTESFQEELGDNLKTFSGTTDSYWKDLESKDKKFMIISIGNGDFVRSADKMGGDLSHQDILDNFVILEGIDYKSNDASRRLVYMEV